jgi:hypothetical protein
MPNHFGRSFNNIESEQLLTDLETLENQGCIYNPLYDDDIDDFSLYRIELTPAEIFRFVEAMYAYEEFSGFTRQGYSPAEALDSISSEKIRSRVEEYNKWAEGVEERPEQYCPAAFYGRELESLMTGNSPDRYEKIPRSKLQPFTSDD